MNEQNEQYKEQKEQDKEQDKSISQLDVLKDIGIDYYKLPVLERDPKIQHMRVYLNELTHPIMSWKNNRYDIIIVLAIYGHGNERNTYLKGKPYVKNIRGTFQLYVDPSSLTDIKGVATPDEIFIAYNCYHEKNGHKGLSIHVCDTCEIINGRISMTWLKKLILGIDPLFKVGFNK